MINPEKTLYQPNKIEPEIQKKWQQDKQYEVQPDSKKPKQHRTLQRRSQHHQNQPCLRPLRDYNAKPFQKSFARRRFLTPFAKC